FWIKAPTLRGKNFLHSPSIPRLELAPSKRQRFTNRRRLRRPGGPGRKQRYPSSIPRDENLEGWAMNAFRECSCRSKTSHATRKEAEREIESIQGRLRRRDARGKRRESVGEIKPYRCRWCGQWHV